MNQLTVTTSWQDGGKVRGKELNATWALFRISVGDLNLVECVDDYSKTVRDDLVIPVYPIAEWFASNWWRLWNESSVHFLQSAAEGFALPDIRIRTTGTAVHVEAHPAVRPLAKIRFLNAGSYWLNTAQCVAEISRFIDSVCERLEQQGVLESFLQQEWNAIRDVESQQDQLSARFCRSAGQMGLDPFDIDSRIAAKIENALKALPQSIQADFFEIASSQSFEAQLKQLESILGHVGSIPTIELGRLIKKGPQRAIDSHAEPPWKVGYDLARQVRQQLKLGERGFKTVEELMDVLPLKKEGILTAPLNIVGVDALLSANPSGSKKIRCAIRGGRPAARLFHAARAVGELFYSNELKPALFTSAGQLDRQQRSRAFAAEFLAPASLIRKKISGTTLNADAAKAIAESFGVSDWVIRDQVENQKIAEIVT